MTLERSAARCAIRSGHFGARTIGHAARAEWIADCARAITGNAVECTACNQAIERGQVGTTGRETTRAAVIANGAVTRGPRSEPGSMCVADVERGAIRFV